MVAVGSSVHRYSTIFGTFRISIWGIISLVLINSLYFAALWTHYEHQQQIHVIRMFSQLLHDCVYLHLLIGVINWLVIMLQYQTLVDFASQVADDALVNQKNRKRGSIVEWFVYYRMWSNTCVLICLNVYNLYFLDLRNLTGTKIMLIIGLAYPHFMIADILRFVTIQALLVNAKWYESNCQLSETQFHANDDILKSISRIKSPSAK